MLGIPEIVPPTCLISHTSSAHREVESQDNGSHLPLSRLKTCPFSDPGMMILAEEVRKHITETRGLAEPGAGVGMATGQPEATATLPALIRAGPAAC